MAAAAEAGEIQSNKIVKTRKLENWKNRRSRMSYQVAFAKAGENLSLQQLEKLPKSQKLNFKQLTWKNHELQQR